MGYIQTPIPVLVLLHPHRPNGQYIAHWIVLCFTTIFTHALYQAWTNRASRHMSTKMYLRHSFVMHTWYSVLLLALIAAVALLLSPSAGASTQNTNNEHQHFVLAPLSEPDVVENGSFEIGPDPGAFILLDVGDTQITGWTVTRGAINYKGTYWQHSDGSRSLDLNGEDSAGGVVQTLETTPGNSYSVCFDMAGNPVDGPRTVSMRVAAAGYYEDFTFNTAGHDTDNMGWTTKMWSFIANSGSTDLEFYSLDAPSPYGPALDNVRFCTPTPTPTNTATRTPTPTATNTPTSTPTHTPTPTPEPQPPLYTTSYYIQEYDPASLRSLGCAARNRGETGVAILHFGSPRVLPGQIFGTKMYDVAEYLTLEQIAKLAERFALGYADPAVQCSFQPPGTPRDLLIVLGISNSARIAEDALYWQDNEYLTREHGIAWAQMINRLYRDVFVPNLLPGIRIAAGYDSEYYGHPSTDCRNFQGRRGPCPGGNPPFGDGSADPYTVWHVEDTEIGTRDWAEGYDHYQGLTEHLTLYNYGSCEDCPRTRYPSQWNSNEQEVLLRVSQMTWLMTSAVPFPQVYFIRIPYEWYNVRWYAQREGGRTIYLRGALTGCQAAPQGNPCTPVPNPTRIVPRFDIVCHANDNNDPDCSSQPPSSWPTYNCGLDCPYLPPSVGWQALSDMVSSPNMPEGLPNPEVTPQPYLFEGVSDIVFQP